MKKALIISFIAFVLLINTGGAEVNDDSVPGTELTGESQFFEVYFSDPALARKIVRSFNTLESKYEQGSLLVEISNSEELEKLQNLDVYITEISNPFPAEGRMESLSYSGIPGYTCYRTVEETFATAATYL